MRWIDGHIDLAYLAVNGRDVRDHVVDSSQGCISIPALVEGGIEMIFGTIFTEPGIPSPDQPHLYVPGDPDSAYEAGMRQLDCYLQLQREGRITIVRSKADLEADSSSLKVLLLMEGADPIRSPDDAGFWFDHGVRIVGLAWAAGTRYAGGNSTGGPLTAQGAELVSALDDLGVIHDMSHLSDAAFDAVAAQARGPIVASHSNCRALLRPRHQGGEASSQQGNETQRDIKSNPLHAATPHAPMPLSSNQRHLRDDQIRAIAGRGGIIGLNLYSPFLAIGRRASMADCIAHLDHVCSIVRHRGCVALGSDMDGGFGPDRLPHKLESPARLHNLADALQQHGWPQRDITAFASENWRKFLQRSLPQ